MERILIMLSTYNGEKYLKEQLDSIMNQQVHDLEINLYIRDDCSTDHTKEILQDYQNQYSCIEIEFGQNVGVVESFFSMLKKANGYDYYAFSDQDDIWKPTKIQRAVDALKTLDLSQPCLYASCSTLVDNQMNELGITQIDRKGICFYNTIIQNLMPGHSQVFNQKLVDLINQVDLDCSRIVVHDFWLALNAVTFGQIYFDNEPQTLYRQHENNEIGYNKGKLGWITERIKRVKNQAAKDITRQDQYFYDLYSHKMKNEYQQELYALLHSQKNILTRFGYILKSKVYRQRHFETMLFYILYLFGGYKIDES